MIPKIGLIGCDNEALGTALREQLVYAGLSCDSRSVVSLSQLVDRASLEMPHLIVIEQGSSLNESVALIRELATVVPSHIVSIGPADDPRRIMSIMQAGANEYIDSELWQSTLKEAVVRFRTRNLTIAGRESMAHVISVICPIGGGGGSTIAVNVASILARKHESTLLMDLRLETGDLSALLDLHPNFTLADLCSNLERLDDSLFEQILADHSSGIHLLAAPQDRKAVENVTAKGLRRALAFGKRKFPYVVLDLGGAHSAIHHEAISQSDVVAVVVRFDVPSIRNARRCLEQLDALGVDRSKRRIVVNRYGLSRQLTTQQAQDALGCKVDLFLPEDAASVNLAMNSGKPVVSVKPWSKLSRRLVELAGELNGRHTQS
jgi:pilus assembly protein CpaE